ncbi:LysR family transcriptional regulator [Spirillospora sp. NPDC047279]|uniref:LysR family transcriptional regulator n=1 Tax=Spirillospora sp. NPDC047279 TaxID=3155478 RepID=UPI003408642C
MLNPKRLVLLRDLADYGTVTAVADIHQVTPSAVSQQLRALETETGAVLLHREGRTVRLTAVGAALARQSEHVLAELERAQSIVRSLGDQVVGELRTGCFPSALAPVAAPFVRALAERHPALRPRVTQAEPEEAVPMLKRRDLDIALHYRYLHLGTPAPEGLTARRLLDDPLVLAIPERLRPLVEREGLAALRGEKWITTAPASSCRDVTLHACHSAGFTPVIEHEYDDLAAALALVALDLGVTILPGLLCGNVPPGVATTPLPGKGRTIEVLIRAGSDDHPAVAAALSTLTAVTTDLEAALTLG